MGVTSHMLALRSVLRSTARDRSYVVACLVTTAVTIALNAVIIGAVRGILDPAPFPNAGHTYAIATAGTDDAAALDDPTYQALEQGVGGMGRMAAYRWATFSLDAGGIRQEVAGAYVTPRLFAGMGVAPFLGRLPADNSPFEALISHSLWMRQYFGSREVVGSRIVVNSAAFAIVGIMPEGFRFPVNQELWLPLAARPVTGAGRDGPLFALGFTAPGTSLATVNQQLKTMARPGTGAEGQHAVLQAADFKDTLVSGDSRSLAYLLLVAGGALTALAAMNVSALVAAREITRLRERAVQRALGASDRRILGETLVSVAGPAAPGMLLGLLVGVTVLTVVHARFGAQLPYWMGFDVGATGLVWCGLLTTLLIAVAVGAGSSQVRRRDPSTGLREGTRGFRDSQGATTRRRAIAFVQVCFAVAVLVVSARIVQSTQAFLHRSPGFTSSGLLTFRLANVPAIGGSANDALDRVQGAVDRLRSIAGVSAASLASSAPAAGLARSAPIDLGGAARDSGVFAIITGIGPEFLETLGLSLQAGRDLREDDGRESGRANVVVNRKFADRLLRGLDPLGKVFRIQLDSATVEATIVGVTRDISDVLASEPIEPSVYLPLRVLGTGTIYVLARAADGEGGTLLSRLGAFLHSELPRTTFARQASLNDLRAELYAQESLLAGLGVLLASATGALALIGIVSLVRLEVTRERHDVAVKLALGADPYRVGARLLLEVTVLGIAAVSAGALLAHSASGVLGFLMFGVAAHGAGPYVWTCVLVASVVFATGLLGWLRLARLDPALALR